MSCSLFFCLQNTYSLRSLLLITVTLFGVIPLGMMQSLESLSRFSAISLSFYVFFALHVSVSMYFLVLIIICLFFLRIVCSNSKNDLFLNSCGILRGKDRINEMH